MSRRQKTTAGHVVVGLNTRSARSSHYVCFTCRKQFRKPSAALYTADAGGRERLLGRGVDEAAFSYPCPQCGQVMRLIGKNFRAPRQDDREAWAIAKQLLYAGFDHGHSTGLAYPTRLKDVDPFLKRWRLSEGEKLLEKWQENNA